MPFIPLEVYANNPSTTVPAGCGAVTAGTVEAWTVASSVGFPAVELGATQFHIGDPALPGEIITVLNVNGLSWTVGRGAEGTVPVAHPAGFQVVQVITAGALTAGSHPPWQFPVQVYGAQGDGKIGAGGTGASGQPVLTDAGASFVNAPAPSGDVGKVIIVNQGPGSATSFSNPFCGTILAVNSPTSITLSGNLAATCTNAPYIYGTDDAGPVAAAVLAAARWAVATGNYKAQIMFEPQNYMLGALTQTTAQQWSPFNTGANYTYNTHIPIPFAGQYDRKLILDFIGTGDASNPDFWGSVVPNIQGSCLVSAVWAAAEPNGTYGQMSVLGGPSSQANIGNGGITNAGYGNVLVNIEGLSAITPFNSQQYGFDLRWCAQAHLDSSAAQAFAPVNYSGQACGGPWMRSTNLPTNGVAFGLAMPACGNNALTQIGRFSCEGLANGVMISEHFTAQHLVTMYCYTGMAVTWLPAGSVIHGGAIQVWTCEGCYWGVVSNNSATCQYPLFIGDADFEVAVFGYVNDPNGNLTGTMYWHDLATWTPAGAATAAVNWKMVNTRMPVGPWLVNASLGIPAAPTAPATGTPQQNTSYRDAAVYLSDSSGITGVSIGPASGSLTALGLTAAAGAWLTIRVPGGHWYSVTHSGTLTTKWVIE